MMKQPYNCWTQIEFINIYNRWDIKTYNHLFDNVELFDTEKNLLQKIDILIDNLEVLYIKKDNSMLYGIT